MAQQCWGSLQACAFRISSLVNCVPDVGVGKAYVSDSIISLNLTFDITKGDEFEQKTGCGDIALSYRDCDRLKGVTWEISGAVMDHELMGLMTGAGLVNVAGQNIGHTSPDQSTCGPQFSLEWWTKRVQKGNCVPASALPYWQWTIPWNEATIGGSLNFQNGFTTMTITGFGRENSLIGTGPFADWPVAMNARLYGMWATATKPSGVCGAIDIPA